jgi:hypothetical protein
MKNEAEVNLPAHVLAAVEAYLDRQDADRGSRPSMRASAVDAEPGEMPSPPFPSPDNDMLTYLMRRAMAQLGAGASVRQVIVHLAVHAWMEGHVEGFDHGQRLAQRD